jgi:hypothetical protein
MTETDIKDKRGNIIISPGLKVRHKDSQYEYTVDQVLQEPDGKVTVMLASPEEPRFDPAAEDGVLSDRKKKSSVLYEADPVSSLDDLFYLPAEDDEQEDDLLAVPADEFEKEYEVK